MPVPAQLPLGHMTKSAGSCLYVGSLRRDRLDEAGVVVLDAADLRAHRASMSPLPMGRARGLPLADPAPAGSSPSQAGHVFGPRTTGI